MAKYCSSVPIDEIFSAEAPQQGAEYSRLLMCPGAEPHCSRDAPEKFGACHPCGGTKSLSCIAGCATKSRYSTCDWEKALEQNVSDALMTRTSAERQRTETWKDIQMADKKAQNRQCDNTKHLAERTYDIAFWKANLLKEIRRLDTELGNLGEVIRIMERILCETNMNRAIVEECLRQREKRLGIDCVHDDVERALCKELDIITKVQEMLREFIKRAKCQMKKSRAVQHNAEVDVRDKHHAQGIDDRAHQLRNSSCGITVYPGVEIQDKTITDEASWVRYTNNNIRLCIAEMQSSERLRWEIDVFLRGAVNEMWHQYKQTNSAFHARIQELNDGKKRLQDHLERVNNEIRDQDRTVHLLRKSIMHKESCLKVAQSRLNERTYRRCIELTNDLSMKGLQKEVKELFDEICRIKERLREAEAVLCRLLKIRSTLEQDIAVKENSIQIDQSFCLNLRRKMALDPKIGPALILPHIEC